MEVIEARAREVGAEVVAGGLKVEGDAGAAPADIMEFVNDVARNL